MITARQGLLGLLFLAEIAGLAVVPHLAEAGEHIAYVANSASARLALMLGVGIALALTLLGAAHQRDDVRLVLNACRRALRSRLFLAIQLVAYSALLYLITLLEKSPNESPADQPTLLQGALIAMGALWLACWFASALSEPTWMRSMHCGLDVTLTGALLGAVAVGFGRLTTFLWEPLGDSTRWAVHQSMTLLYRDVVFVPESAVLGTPEFRVRILTGCGGYEGIGLILFLLTLYVLAFRRELRWPAALMLFPVGVVLIWLSNVARIVALIAIGHSVSPEIATQGFHSQAGWLLFTAIGLGIIGLSRQMPLFMAPHDSAPGEPSSTSAFLAPLVALLATIMLTAAFTADFDLLYPLRVVVVLAVVWWYRAAYAQWDWRPTWQAVAIGVGVFAIWIAFEPAAPQGATETFTLGLDALPAGWRWTWLAFRAFGSSVTVPLAEELAFRGYLTRRLISDDPDSVPLGQFSWFSFLASSVVFGAMHGRWLAGTLAGMAYALALYRRRSLPDAVVAHGTTNAIIAWFVVAGGRWSLWT